MYINCCTVVFIVAISRIFISYRQCNMCILKDCLFIHLPLRNKKCYNCSLTRRRWWQCEKLTNLKTSIFFGGGGQIAALLKTFSRDLGRPKLAPTLQG